MTDDVRDQAIAMIDSGFGLALWAEAGEKALESRKKKLEEVKAKLLSPQPPKRKIKPNVHDRRIFEDGDIVAVQLQTKGKPHTEAEQRPLSEAEFHALDGKYVLMQLVECRGNGYSAIVPEIKDYWACFRLFDGICDEVPDEPNISSLNDAWIHQGGEISPFFICESSMTYFKKRNYRVLGNHKELLSGLNGATMHYIFWGSNNLSTNPDSQLVAAVGKKILCGEFKGSENQMRTTCQRANRYDRFIYRLSGEENKAIFEEEERIIAENIERTLANGGKLYGISFGKEIGLVTVEHRRIDNLFIEGQYQKQGFGMRLLEYAFSVAGTDAYIEIPKDHDVLKYMCKKIRLKTVRMKEDYITRGSRKRRKLQC